MDRSVLVRLRAEVGQYRQAMRDAAKSTEQVGDAAQKAAGKTDSATKAQASAAARLAESARKNEQAWTTAGAAITAAGAAITGALVASVKAAIDWETAWTGVLKTVDGTPEQLAAVEAGLRDLARRRPVSHADIAAVAEAAGQLGVATDNVVAFTEVMVDLDQTTNLTADEAATAVAQLMNIMQTAPEDVDNLGAALVALGNDGASTERDIIQMAQRIAGAAKIVGASEADVLAIANAVASVGVEVEAGGSAVSRVLTDIAKAVSQGGAELDGFAEVAGTSSAEFVRAFRDDPAAAFALFVEGLDRIRASGGDVFTVLDRLGQSDVRTSRALLSMAGAGDLLRESLDLGSRAWEENTALSEEAEKRYQTTAAQLGMLRNQITDAAMSLGVVFLPAVNAVAGGLGTVAEFIGGLPGPLRTTVAVLGAVAGAATLAAGSFLLLAPRIVATKDALVALGVTAPRAAGAMRSMLGVLGGPWGIALVSAGVLLSEFAGRQAAARARVEELSAAIDAQTGVLDRAGLEAIAAMLTNVDKASGWERLLGGRDVGLSAEQWAKYGLSVSEAVTAVTGSEEAFRAYQSRANEVARANGIGVDAQNDLNNALQGARDAYVAAQGAAEDNAAATEAGGQAWEAATGQAADLEQALKNAAQALKDLQDAFRDDEAAAQFEENLDKLDAQWKKWGERQRANARAMDITTEAGRTMDRWMREQITTAAEHAQAVFDETGSIEQYKETLRSQRQRIQEVAQAKRLDRQRTRELLAELDRMKPKYITGIDLTVDDRRPAWLRRLMEGTGQTIPLVLRPEYVGAAREAGGRFPGERRARGGLITGPGGPTDDLIPAWLSNGEYVLQASAVQALGVDFLDRLNEADGFASGGLVGSGSSSGAIPTVDVAALVAVFREMAKVIDVDEWRRAQAEVVSAWEAVAAAQRDVRDARRGVRDTRESNRERRRSAREAVKDAEERLEEAERKKRKAKNAKQRRAAEKEAADAQRDLARARRERRKARRDGREALDDATYRQMQAEEALIRAREAAKQATKDAAEADRAYAESRKPLIEQFTEGLDAQIKDTATFLANIETLAKRGHTSLAATLLERRDTEAETIAQQAVGMSDAAVKAIEARIGVSASQQDRLTALPTVFRIMDYLRTNPGAGVALTSFALGIDLVELQQAAATAKDLIAAIPGAQTFLAELARNGYASGGWVHGPGTSRSDSIPARLSAGEYVVQAPAARALGPQVMEAINNAHRMRPVSAGQPVVVREYREVPRDLIVRDVDGALVGRMRVEAEQTVGEFARAAEVEARYL